MFFLMLLRYLIMSEILGLIHRFFFAISENYQHQVVLKDHNNW